MASHCSAQLAIDTTMVSPVRSDGTVRRQCTATSGAALDQARRQKERTYTELAQPHGRARLVAAAKARCEPEVMRKSTMLSWIRRWSTLGVCRSKGVCIVFAGKSVWICS